MSATQQTYFGLASSLLDIGRGLYEKFSKLSQDQLNDWAKSAKLDFPVSAGTRTMPDIEIGKFSNNKLKTKSITKMTRATNGKVKGLKIDPALAEVPNYLETAGAQAICQMIVFNLGAEFYVAPNKVMGENGKWKNVAKTGSKNLTPYGVAARELFTLLGVEDTMKMEVGIFLKDEDTDKMIWTGAEKTWFIKLDLINKPQTEAQKEALANGQKSKARGGVAKGKSQKTKQLESSLAVSKQKIQELLGYLQHLNEEGMIEFNTQKDIEEFDHHVKKTEEGTIEVECGMAEVEIAESPPPQVAEVEEEERPVMKEPSGASVCDIDEEDEATLDVPEYDEEEAISQALAAAEEEEARIIAEAECDQEQYKIVRMTGTCQSAGDVLLHAKANGGTKVDKIIAKRNQSPTPTPRRRATPPTPTPRSPSPEPAPSVRAHNAQCDLMADMMEDSEATDDEGSEVSKDEIELTESEKEESEDEEEDVEAREKMEEEFETFMSSMKAFLKPGATHPDFNCLWKAVRAGIRKEFGDEDYEKYKTTDQFTQAKFDQMEEWITNHNLWQEAGLIDEQPMIDKWETYYNEQTE